MEVWVFGGMIDTRNSVDILTVFSWGECYIRRWLSSGLQKWGTKENIILNRNWYGTDYWHNLCYVFYTARKNDTLNNETNSIK